VKYRAEPSVGHAGGGGQRWQQRVVAKAYTSLTTHALERVRRTTSAASALRARRRPRPTAEQAHRWLSELE